MNPELIDRLRALAGEEAVRTMEPMSAHTTLRIGGPADVFAAPGNAEQLRQMTALCREYGQPFYLLGRGSNLLVADEGYRGVMISTERLCGSVRTGTEIEAEAGISLRTLAKLALEASLTGLEFAAGIPGTLGGAVVMNAGAYGSEIRDVLTGAKVLTPAGEIHNLTNEELKLGYRSSCIPENGYIVLSARLRLAGGDGQAIRDKMDDLAAQRKSRQPLEYPSAGSMFKRPPGYFAARLIDDAGLRGFRVGGAQVSEKHCGFVVNRGGATAAEVLELCGEVSRIVYEKFGVMLEREVKYLG